MDSMCWYLAGMTDRRWSRLPTAEEALRFASAGLEPQRRPNSAVLICRGRMKSLSSVVLLLLGEEEDSSMSENASDILCDCTVPTPAAGFCVPFPKRLLWAGMGGCGECGGANTGTGGADRGDGDGAAGGKSEVSNMSNKFALLAATGAAAALTTGAVLEAGARFLSRSENIDVAATVVEGMGTAFAGATTEGAGGDGELALVGLMLPPAEPPQAAPVVGAVANTPWGTFFLLAPAAAVGVLLDPPPTPPNRAAAIFSFSVNTFGLFSTGAAETWLLVVLDILGDSGVVDESVCVCVCGEGELALPYSAAAAAAAGGAGGGGGGSTFFPHTCWAPLVPISWFPCALAMEALACWFEIAGPSAVGPGGAGGAIIFVDAFAGKMLIALDTATGNAGISYGVTFNELRFELPSSSNKLLGGAYGFAPASRAVWTNPSRHDRDSSMSKSSHDASTGSTSTITSGCCSSAWNSMHRCCTSSDCDRRKALSSATTLVGQDPF